MKTKREVLGEFAEKGYCSGIECSDCAYLEICGSKERLTIKGRLQKIGAMAILRMFREKKKPLIRVGTKIKFDNGKIAEVRLNEVGYQLCFIDSRYTTIDYLVDKTWEVIE